MPGPGDGRVRGPRFDYGEEGVPGPDHGEEGVPGPDYGMEGVPGPDICEMGVSGPGHGELGVGGPSHGELGVEGPGRGQVEAKRGALNARRVLARGWLGASLGLAWVGAEWVRGLVGGRGWLRGLMEGGRCAGSPGGLVGIGWVRGLVRAVIGGLAWVGAGRAGGLMEGVWCVSCL